jgi:hypothetical protein
MVLRTLAYGSNTGAVNVNPVIDGGESCDRTKLGGNMHGCCGPDNVMAASIAGPPSEIRFAVPILAVGAPTARNETQGTTVAGPVIGTLGSTGVLTTTPLGPVTPMTAPAGITLTSRKMLAMAIAIKYFTLISIPSLVKQYSTRQNKKLI